MISDLRGRTTLRCIVTALHHILIMLNVNVESISQPCLAISWALSVIGTALLILVMSVLHESQFQSRMLTTIPDHERRPPLYADRVEKTCGVCAVIYITGEMLWYFDLSGYDETPMCHDMYVCLHGMATSYLIVMIQTLLWLMVKWSDVNVVHSDHMCHMNLQCEMVVTDHNGCSHMFSEKGYPSVSLSVIIMFCLCSVHTCGIVLC